MNSGIAIIHNGQQVELDICLQLCVFRCDLYLVSITLLSKFKPLLVHGSQLGYLFWGRFSLCPDCPL